MGFSGNLDPDFVIPSAIADVENKSNIAVSRMKNEEYNFYIGYQGIQTAKNSQNHRLYYPLENGIISNWDLMEKFWHQSLYNYMKCDPQEHYMVLTEPPMNPPENRENIAEIFFETFNVPGLFIGVQAVFALLGCNQTFSAESSTKKNKKGEEAKLVKNFNSRTKIKFLQSTL
jgi:actin-related protein 3